MKKRKFADGGPMRWNTTDYASSGSAGGTNIDFKDAFRAARKQGLGTFTWRGKKYTTELASEKKSDSSESASSGTSGGPTSRSGPRFSSGTSGGPTNRGGPRRQEAPKKSFTGALAARFGTARQREEGASQGYKSGDIGKSVAARLGTAAQREKYKDEFKRGGKVKKYSSGGKVYRSKADGIASRGHTKAKQC